MTIRLPDLDRLRGAKVEAVHVNGGGEVCAGQPVMTVVTNSNERIVRAPHRGNVFPVLASGDSAPPGGPLFVLKVDQASIMRAKREARSRPEPPKTRDDDERIRARVQASAFAYRPREKADISDDLKEATTAWVAVLQALILVVAASYIALPILGAFAYNAPVFALAGMLVGCLSFGLLLYHFFGSEDGSAAMWATRFIIVAWVGLSSGTLISNSFSGAVSEALPVIAAIG